mmetsp:Transcript_96047/g.250198  ORF Transcript_96047/g.250198 Transcript_96047/m.250198 type:complete len:246 (+) Transcript_96047:481-1218(+)
MEAQKDVPAAAAFTAGASSALPPGPGRGSVPSRQARRASWKLAADSSSSKAPWARLSVHAAVVVLCLAGAFSEDFRGTSAAGASSVAPKLTRRRSPGAVSAIFFLSLMTWPGAMPMSRMWLSSMSLTTSMQSKPCSMKRPTYLSRLKPVKNASTSAASVDCLRKLACRFADALPPAARPPCAGGGCAGATAASGTRSHSAGAGADGASCGSLLGEALPLPGALPPGVLRSPCGLPGGLASITVFT